MGDVTEIADWSSHLRTAVEDGVSREACRLRLEARLRLRIGLCMVCAGALTALAGVCTGAALVLYMLGSTGL